ncbi:MAG: hypothetical protein RLZZ357_1606 [Bacteroidota bacterium]
MSNLSIWKQTKRIAVVWDYTDEQQMRTFVKAIDHFLQMNKFAHALIIVNVPKDLDKKNLPPHFLIYYNSPADFSFFGKLKDIQLEAELQKAYDLLIWNAALDAKIYPLLKETSINRRVLVNAQNAKFDLQIDTVQSEPAAQLDYIQQTLERIAQ